MQGLSLTQIETVVNELLVFCKNCSFYYPVSAIHIVVEKGMPPVLHVHPDLMGPSGLQPAFHKANIFEVFQHSIMGNGIFPVFAIREYVHQFSEPGVSSNIALNGAFHLIKISPYKGHVPSFYGMFKELPGKFYSSQFRLGQDNKPSCVFINSVHHAKPG